MTSGYTVRRVVLARQPTAVMRAELAPEQMSQWLPECYWKVAEYLRTVDVQPAGPPFARFTFLADVIAVEAGFPCTAEITGDGEVEPSALPGGPAAVTTHMGRYDDLGSAYKAVHAWLVARGRAEAGPHWEVYFTDPTAEPDSSHWRTDVVTPYRAA